MMPNKQANLFDHVFNIMEEYTTTLELEVEERTKELSAEKKKADVLLGRMLPRYPHSYHLPLSYQLSPDKWPID